MNINTDKIKGTLKAIGEIDNGKILAAGSKAIESIDLKKAKKLLNVSFEGPAMDAVKGKLRLAKDIATWPVNYVEGLIGAIKNR